jgi:hypothetical protein
LNHQQQTLCATHHHPFAAASLLAPKISFSQKEGEECKISKQRKLICSRGGSWGCKDLELYTHAITPDSKHGEDQE